ncbi:MAG: sensor histidine kinase [Sphingomonadales bacterium]|nr:sensor histidine kinase [Sphingomonadales bacterium]
MRYDDRLATVLRISGTSASVARIQFQQLIDLLGTSPAEARGELLDQAHVKLAELSRALPADERAAALGMPGLRLRSPRLVAALACAEPVVAAAAVRAADLAETQWLDLIPALPAGARGILRVRNDHSGPVRALMARLGIGDAALPGTPAPGTPDSAAPVSAVSVREIAVEPEPVMAPVVPFPAKPSPAPAPAPATAIAPVSGIGAIVERIEAFRRARDSEAQAGVAPGELPQLPLGDTPREGPARAMSIDFTTDVQGRIDWAERMLAPMLAGTDLTAFAALRDAMRRRQPVRGETIVLRGAAAVAGAWRIDAMPRFETGDGRFGGYFGRLRRVATGVPAEPAPVAGEADALRQVLHELRTPVNAIQGFAEIIQHQLYGPTPHEYRALSAVIVADAARMLAGFEELDRLARLGTGTMAPESGECDLAAVVRGAVARLKPHAGARGFALHIEDAGEELPVAMAPVEAERLSWRLLAAAAGAAQAGDVLGVALARIDGRAAVIVSLPAGLAMLDDAALFSGEAPFAATNGEGAALTGMFGTGFALRLARIEARAAGGSLNRHEEMLNLSVPLLTSAPLAHSDSAANRVARKENPAA